MDKSQPRSGVFYGWSLCRQRWRPHELRANVVSGTLGGFPGQRSSSVSCLDALLISRESRDNKNLNEPITPKKRGRPITANAEKKREDARLRQQRARRKQKLVKLFSFRLVGAKSADRPVWLAFLAWAHDCGDDLLVGVEFEGGGRTMRFSEIADLF